MVDVRPLIFANALVLMLLATAGFAHISSQDPFSGSAIPTTNVSEPNISEPNDTDVAKQSIEVKSTESPIEAEQVTELNSPNTASTDTMISPEINDSDIFADNSQDIKATIDKNELAPQADLSNTTEVPSSNTQLAVVAPAIVNNNTPATAEVISPQKQDATPKPKPKPIATTGTVIIRSNIEGDMVLIDGKPYGPTRLEVELAPGSYAIEVAKSGYSSWQTDIAVQRGKKQTLKAKLEHYTTVDYRNGEWINGITTGEGSYLTDDGIRYQGAFVNGKFHGIGSIAYPDGTEYRGEWFEGVMQGDGTLLTNQGDTFVGIFKDGEFNGEGTLTKSNGDIYNGYWVNGTLNGQGSLTTKDGLLFVGGFSENQFHGDGSLTYPDGRHYEGSFSKGQFHGKGIEIYANGKKYAGQFMEGQYHGKGELMNPNGSKITGTFKFGLPFGKATLTTPEGEIFTARTTEPGVCYRLKSYRATQCPPMEGW